MAYKKYKSKKANKNKKRYSTAEKASYKKGFWTGLFVSRKKKKQKVSIPKNATKTQRHNILMRDDPDYLVAYRAARRSASDIEDTTKYEKAVSKYTDEYYASIKRKTDYGKYLISKFDY